LESRRQLLIAESELNRTALVGQLNALAGDARALSERAGKFIPIASSAASLVAGIAAFQPSKSANGHSKPSWIPSLLKGAGLVSTVWLAIRSRARHMADR
jgi:hypothetical protein